MVPHTISTQLVVTPRLEKLYELLPELFSCALNAMQRSEANNKIISTNIKMRCAPMIADQGYSLGL